MSHRFLWLVLPTIITSILFCSPARAQLSKGLIAGWNRSDWESAVDGITDDFFEPKNGFCAGIYLSGNLAGQLGLRGEVLYTRKGAKTVFEGTAENGEPLGEVDTFYNVDYLEIPLLLNWTIPTRGAVRPVLYLGPAVGFELAANEETKYPSGVLNTFQKDAGLETASSTDFSLVFAGGIDIDAAGKVINLQVRYIMGLQEVYLTSKNRTLSLMAGFGI